MTADANDDPDFVLLGELGENLFTDDVLHNIVSQAVASQGHHSTVLRRLGLQLACQPCLTASRATSVVMFCINNENMDELFHAFVDGLCCAQRYSLLCAVAEPTCNSILPRVDRVSSTVYTVLRKLLLGFQHSLVLLRKVAAFLLKQEHSARCKELVADLVAIHWKNASVFRRVAPELEEDRPIGLAARADILWRENSWVRNAGTPVSLLRESEVSKFQFSYPFFAWPEGRWVLEPQPGQGTNPYFSLTARVAGQASNIRGLGIGAGDHKLMKIEGSCIESGSTRVFLINTESSSEASGSGLTTDTKATVSLVQTFDSLWGTYGRGSEAKPVFGIPRIRSQSGETQLFTGRVCTSPTLHEIAILRADQRLVLNHRAHVTTQGWAFQAWVPRPQETGGSESDWTTIVDVKPFTLSFKKNPSASGGIRLRLVGQGLDIAEQTTFSRPFGWFHVLFTGDKQAISIYVDGKPLWNNITFPVPAPDRVGPFSIPGPGAAPTFVKVWAHKFELEHVLIEYKAAFSTSSTPEALKPLAFIIGHGPWPLALFDVSGHGHHLLLEQDAGGVRPVKFAPIQTLSAGLLDTPKLLTLDRENNVMIFGGWQQEENNGARIVLNSGSSAWCRALLSASESLSIDVQVKSIPLNSGLEVILFGGSIWDLIPTRPLSRSVRFRFQSLALDQEGHFSVMLSILCNEDLVIKVPLAVGRITPGPQQIQLNFSKASGFVEVSIAKQNVAHFKMDIAEILGVSLVDGVYVGFAAMQEPVTVESWRLTGFHSAITNSLAHFNESGSVSEVPHVPESTPAESRLAAKPSEAFETQDKNWICPRCTCENSPLLSSCVACEGPRPSSTAPGPQSVMSSGTSSTTALETWQCSVCTYENKGSALTCAMCSSPNPSAAAKSNTSPGTSLVVADTWKCGMCTAETTTQKGTCSVCGNSKSLSESKDKSKLSEQPSVAATGPSDASHEAAFQAAVEKRKEFLSKSIQKQMASFPAKHEGLPQEWDTTIGDLLLQESETSSVEPKFGLALSGEYGENEGFMQAIAIVDQETLQWSLQGLWVQYAVSDESDASFSRFGARSIRCSLSASGEELSGTWTSGSSAEGALSGKLEGNHCMFRGMNLAPPPATAVTSVKEMMEREKIQSRVPYLSDESLRFRPSYTGLANMAFGLTNVCYQNAILQALFMTSKLRHTVLFPSDGVKNNSSFFVAVQQLMSRLLLSQSTVEISKQFNSVLQRDWQTGQQMDVADFHDYMMNELVNVLPPGTLQGMFGSKIATVYKCTSCLKSRVKAVEELGIKVTLPRQYLPITDITAVRCRSLSKLGDIQVPPGFELLRANLNKDKAGAPCVYLCVKRGKTQAPITSLVVTRVAGTESVPPPREGYEMVPIDLNPGDPTQQDPSKIPDRIFLFFQRDSKGSPITEIQVLTGESEIASPKPNFRVVPTDVNPSWVRRAALPTPGEATKYATRTHSNQDSSNMVPAGPATTPIKISFARGMPVMDVVLSPTSPSGTDAEYQVIDTPLNLGITNTSSSDSSDVFLWVSGSKSFPSPITELLLVAEDNFEELDGFEVCGPYRFAGNKVLLKRRGNGCPLTQVAVFRAPKSTPLFRFGDVLGLTSRQAFLARNDMESLTLLTTLPWMPNAVLDTQETTTRTQHTKWADGIIGAPSGDPLPTTLLEPRGKALFLKFDQSPIVGVFAHGVYAKLPGIDIPKANFYGILSGGAQSSSWTFQGIARDSAQPNRACLVTFKVQEGTSGVSLRGTVLENQTTTPMKSAELNMSRSSPTVSSTAPIVEICVFREDEQLPSGFELVHSIGQPSSTEQSNVNLNTGQAAVYLAVRRSNSTKDDPIVQIGVAAPELEEVPTGFDLITSTPSGDSANLVYGRAGIGMFVCVKRLSAVQNGPNTARAKVVYDVCLQWTHSGQTLPTTLSAHKVTIAGTTEANLGLGGPNTVYLCSESRAPGPRAVENKWNGIYTMSNGASLRLFAVTEPRQGVPVGGMFQSRWSGSGASNSTPNVIGVMLPVKASDNEMDLLPAPMHQKSSQSKSWLFCGEWQSSNPTNENSSPTIWRFSENELTSEIEAFWNRGSKEGVVHFIQDTYLQIGTISDTTEMWKDGKMLFSDRSSDAGVQTLVERAFSSAVLDKNDKLMCEAENVKTTHLEHVVLVRPPEHLVLTVKRMGFDFQLNRPLKELQSTPFSPVLHLPRPNMELLGEVMQDPSASAALEGMSSESRRYGLYAVVVHTGANANSGHYYTYARHSSDLNLELCDSPSSPWVLFNDSLVYDVTWDEMANQIQCSESNTSYLFFYKRLDPASNQKDVETVPFEDSEGNVGATVATETQLNNQALSGQFWSALDPSREQVHTTSVSVNESDLVPDDSNPDAPQLKTSWKTLSSTAQNTILERFGKVQDIPPWLNKIYTANEWLLLHDAESRVSDFYREILGHCPLE